MPEKRQQSPGGSEFAERFQAWDDGEWEKVDTSLFKWRLLRCHVNLWGGAGFLETSNKAAFASRLSSSCPPIGVSIFNPNGLTIAEPAGCC